MYYDIKTSSFLCYQTTYRDILMVEFNVLFPGTAKSEHEAMVL